MKRLHYLLLCCPLLLLGCSSSETKSKEEVLRVLSHPESAKFGLFSESDSHRACLTVDSKNDAGVYVGEHQAKLARLIDGQWVVIDMLPIDHENCVEAMTRNSEIEWFHKEQNN